MGATRDPLHVVMVGVDLDPLHRSPAELISSVWRDFARAEAIAVAGHGLRISVVQAAWSDDRRQVEGIDCHFVRDPLPLAALAPIAPLAALARGRLRGLPGRLAARVTKLDPDIVHFSGLEHPRAVRDVRAALPDRLIVAQDHASRVPDGWRRWLARWGLAALDAVMFCARAQAEPFKQAGVLEPDLPVFEVIEVSTPFTPGDQAAARARTGLGGDPCLLWLGHLDANKDPLMVLDAVAAAAAQLPALRLAMCFRHAPLLDRVKARIQGDGVLAARVTLLGEIAYADMEQHLRAADFLVQASHREGSGYGVIEAIACGTTPLVTDIPSLRRITGDGAVGALVPVGGSDALARAIVDWSRRDRRALREAARRHFERDLSLRAIGGQLRETYQRVSELR